MTLSAVLCGADNWVDVAEWASDNEDWLKKYLVLELRIPVNVNAHSGMVNADSGQRERCGGCGVMLRALIVF